MSIADSETANREIVEALEGYVLDPNRYPDAAGLKTTEDGAYVPIPQPLDTPDDPLNWSLRKKRLILAIVAYIAALADFTGGTAIITVIPQSM
ncbi:hypothetical protein M433DRAFT_24677 [Acidomyces richmondensis BFW]|nr:hypothetical protein M433DRAFT_24677 [Acidomyces richmondensis BFW]